MTYSTVMLVAVIVLLMSLFLIRELIKLGNDRENDPDKLIFPSVFFCLSVGVITIATLIEVIF